MASHPLRYKLPILHSRTSNEYILNNSNGTEYIPFKERLTERKLNFALSLRLVNCYVLSVLLYGTETWTISKVMENWITSFEMEAIQKNDENVLETNENQQRNIAHGRVQTNCMGRIS